jgi:hypothetical protein
MSTEAVPAPSTAPPVAAPEANAGRAPLLSGYLTETEAGREVHRDKRTLKRWRDQGVGPPVTYIGNSPWYSIVSLRRWIERQERDPAEIAKARQPRPRGRPRFDPSSPRRARGRPRKHPPPSEPETPPPVAAAGDGE